MTRLNTKNKTYAEKLVEGEILRFQNARNAYRAEMKRRTCRNKEQYAKMIEQVETDIAELEDVLDFVQQRKDSLVK